MPPAAAEQLDQEVLAQDEQNFLDMPDDAFTELGTDQLPTAEVPAEDADDEQSASGEAAEADLDDTSYVADESDDDKDIADGEASDPTADDADDKEADSEQEEDTSEETPDYEADYKKLTSPFRANGKDMKVDNVDDAIKLMQMGANYNRKMAAMKPGLKVLKMLEKNDLLDESKLSYLIDLNQKNPAAIKQLLKDSELDPMDLQYDSDDESDAPYKAPNRSVDDGELALDDVLESIRDKPSYSKTLSIVGDAWDDKSKQIVADNPQLLQVINDHVANGIYDLVSTEVENERMFGRIDSNISDIEAYRLVGDAMEARGALSGLASNQQPEKVAAKASATKTPDAAEQERRARRKAAGPTKPAAPKASTGSDFNPLAMSDEAFEKQFDARLM